MATFMTPSIIAKEALMVLENETVLASLVYQAYSKEFQKVGSTVTIRKPASFTVDTFADTATAQTITESSVQVVLDNHLDVSFEVTTAELSLDVVSFSEQLIAPAMRAMAQRVDELLAALYVDVGGHTDVTATTQVVGDIAQLREQLNLQKVPMGNRYAVLHPTTEARYLALDAFLHASKTGDTKALRQGSMGRVMGMDFYMDQNIAEHTVDANLALDKAGAIKGAGVLAATSITVDALAGDVTAIVKAGDLLKIAGDSFGYVVTAAATADGTAATDVIIVPISPALKQAEDDDAVVTFQDTHLANLAFHRNAFALVTAPLAPPIGGAKAAVENYKGLSCRAVYDYTMATKKNVISIDMLCGVKTLDNQLAACLSDAQ